MPVRIYDIAKKFGLESKEILVKAKSLGIAAAKVPSSSLDKISAEWLEGEILKDRPDVAERLATPVQRESVKPAPVEEKIVVIKAAEQPAEPIPSPAQAALPEPATVDPVVVARPETATTEASPQTSLPTILHPGDQDNEVKAGDREATPGGVTLAGEAKPPAVSTAINQNGDSQAPVEEALLPAVAVPKPPSRPPEPPKPQLGEKVGFIDLKGFGSSRGGNDRSSGSASRGYNSNVKPPQGNSATNRGENRPLVKPPVRRPDGRGPNGPGPRPLQTPKVTTAKPELPPGSELISMKPPIVVRELAERLRQKPFKIIADLMSLGVFATVNQTVEEKTAVQLCAKYGFRFEKEKRGKDEGPHPLVKPLELDFDDKPEDLKPRAPVVTIMGHVDHGKTSLLDVIRKANVAAGEAGGITQHIGAYTISVPHPEKKGQLSQITFLDTPGHAAFSSMRARGANVTDLVVLVVAANDGVMPQTLEALAHARAAKVPIVVAVNKMDHPNANPLRVRQQLQEKGLAPDDWGGDTIFVECSALTRQGIDKLLEMILLQADFQELKANANRRAKGNVIESGVAPGGPTATVLVRKGTLRLGDVVICGEFYGKVRALINEEGQRLKEAGPSVAVSVLGLNGVPEAGQEFSSVDDEKSARDLAEERALAAKNQDMEGRSQITLENLFDSLKATQNKVLKVVVKADTQGSVEAIVDALKKIESEKVSLEILHSAVGAITENDVAMASASKGVILGFHTRVDSTAAEKAKHSGVQIKLYAIIYELIDQVKDSMAGLLDPDLKEVTVGSAEVRKIFELSKGVPVAGCMVTMGRIVRGKVRVRRRKDVIYEGILQSLRRFQDEVNEVRSGMECGVRIEGYSEFQVGDFVECYAVEKVAAKL